MVKKDTVKKIAIGAAVAGVAGYVAGILTAPKSGKETRKDIADTAHKGVAEAEKQLKKLHTQLSETIMAAKKKADNLSGKAKTQLNDAIEKAGVAKEKSRQILSAVHEGDAEDKDLKKAVGEATKAIDHLKTFLKKS